MRLELFICVVDAQLLKAIDLEAFKAENIEQTERVHLSRVTIGLLHHFVRDRRVHFLDDPVEEFAVDRLGTRISSSDCLLFLILRLNDLTGVLYDLHGQNFGQSRRIIELK